MQSLIRSDDRTRNSAVAVIADRTACRRGNDFSVGGAKIGEKQDNKIQSITLCKKRYTQCTMGSGEFSIIFVLKVTFQSLRLLLTVSYRKMGEQDVLVAPPITLLPPAPPVPSPMSSMIGYKPQSQRHIFSVMFFCEMKSDADLTTTSTDRQTDGRTDGQTTNSRNTALCTIVHRAVKTRRHGELWITNCRHSPVTSHALGSLMI